MGTAGIGKIIEGEVSQDSATLDTYSRDYSIFRVRPEAVVFPMGSRDVERLVAYAARERETGVYVSLTARSAGTDMTGGPLNDSLILDFTRHMHRIKAITGECAVVEPGVYFRDLEKELSARGLLYPAYPASKDLCAVGGMVANDSGGEKTLAYGKTRDYVKELKVVLSNAKERIVAPLSGGPLRAKLAEKSFEGELHRNLYDLIERKYDLIQKAKPHVSKNSAGYALWDVWNKRTFDLTKLFVGSQGTLGLVTEATLRLVKAKKRSRLVVVFLPNLDSLARLIVEILKFKPESLESFDDKTLSVATRFLPGLIRSMRGNAFTLFFQFVPEIVMALRGGFPKMIILAELTSDDEKELDERTRALRDSVKRFGVQTRTVQSDAEAQKYWTIRRQSFKLLHSHSAGKDAASFIDDVIVRPEHLQQFLPELNRILDAYKDKVVYTIAGHPGDGNFHIIPLVNLRDSAVRALIPKIMDEVYELVLRYGGSITAEHNDGLLRSSYLETMYGKEVTALFESVKKMFDPLNIFNPRKKVGGDRAYSLRHIKTD